MPHQSRPETRESGLCQEHERQSLRQCESSSWKLNGIGSVFTVRVQPARARDRLIFPGGADAPGAQDDMTHLSTVTTIRALCLSALAFCPCAALATAETGPSSETDSLAALRADFEALKDRNSALEKSQRGSRRQPGGSVRGLAERGTGREIRGLVQDVLLDSQSRTSLQDSGMSAGYRSGQGLLSGQSGRVVLAEDQRPDPDPLGAQPHQAELRRIEGPTRTEQPSDHLGISDPACQGEVQGQRDRSDLEVSDQRRLRQ